jgi:fructokinase
MRREQRDRVISLDVNVRPTLIRNRDGYLARIDRLAAMTDIIKLSEEDLNWIAPQGRFDELAKKWLAMGAKLIILTRGVDGAIAMSQKIEAEVATPAVKVADTVGAGDTFTAGVLARLDKRELMTKAAVANLTAAQLGDVLSFAAKAAAITVSRPGADPPWLRELA